MSDLEPDDSSFPRSLPQAKPPAPAQATFKRINWPVIFVASVTLLSGLAGTWEPLVVRLSQHPRLFNMLVPYEYYHLSNSLTIAFGYMLIFLSINLYQRKRSAWWLAFLISAFSLILLLARIGSERIHFFQDPQLALQLPLYSALPTVVALICLLSTKSHFTVRSEKESFLETAKIISISLAALILYGCLGFFMLDKNDLGVNYQFNEALLQTIKELSLSGNSDLTPHTRFGKWFLDSLQLSGMLAGAAIIYSAFRPIRYKLLTQPLEHELATTILEQSGRTSLDIFKLLPDKSFYFNSDKDAFIAYKTELNVAIALGDACGPKEKLHALVRDFKQHCHENGWQVAFLQTTPDYLEIYHENGFKTVKVGEDGVIDLAQFVAKTVSKKTFKAVVKKFDKEGYVLQRYSPPIADSVLSEVEVISKAWLALPGRRERGFSLGQFDRGQLQENDLFVMRNPQGVAVAFVNQIRSYADGEVTIDMMRHGKDAPSGAMDYLFAKLLTQLQSENFRYFSLGLAALSGVGESADDPLEEKALHQVYEHLNRFFSYKGLRSYKAKFDPTWQERFLVYEGGPAGLVKTGLAIARATEE